MNNHDKPDRQATADADLAGRFARLREAEAGSAPAIPRVSPAIQPRVDSAWWQTAPARIAAVITVVAVGLFALREPPTEDPAELYLSIVSRQSMSSDALLEVSAAVMPSLVEEPEFFPLDLEFENDTVTNE